MHQTSTENNVRVEVAKLFPNSNFANNNRLYSSTFNLTRKQIVRLYLRLKYTRPAAAQTIGFIIIYLHLIVICLLI